MKKLLNNKKFLFALAFIIGFSAVIFLPSAQNKYSEPCNGHVELCSKKVNEIAYATTHNATSISEDEWFGPSQNQSITAQLNYGYRAFMIDTHYFKAAASLSTYFPEASVTELVLMQKFIDEINIEEEREGLFTCHLICQLGFTPLNDSLVEIKDFLDENPREFVVIIFEDRILGEDTIKSIEESGLNEFLYIKDEETWPELGELIDNNQRLLVLTEFEKPTKDGFYHAWNYSEETPYSFKSVEEMNCSPNRGEIGKDFLILNHWIEKVIPSVNDAQKANEYNFLLDRATKCATERGFKVPNFISVNFHEKGDVIRVVNELNQIKQ